MKTCSACLGEFPLSSFSPQKTNPGKVYSWCDPCRTTASETRVNLGRRGYSFKTEMEELRAKAASLRALNDAQAAVVSKRYKGGESAYMLAKEFNVSKSTIYKEIRRTA